METAEMPEDADDNQLINWISEINKLFHLPNEVPIIRNHKVKQFFYSTQINYDQENSSINNIRDHI